MRTIDSSGGVNLAGQLLHSMRKINTLAQSVHEYTGAVATGTVGQVFT